MNRRRFFAAPLALLPVAAVAHQTGLLRSDREAREAFHLAHCSWLKASFAGMGYDGNSKLYGRYEFIDCARSVAFLMTFGGHYGEGGEFNVFPLVQYDAPTPYQKSNLEALAKDGWLCLQAKCERRESSRV